MYSPVTQRFSFSGTTTTSSYKRTVNQLFRFFIVNIPQVVSVHVESMVVVDLSDAEISASLRALVPSVVRLVHELTSDWLAHCHASKRLHGAARSVAFLKTDLNTVYSVDELTGIEENLWAPVLGVKGQIDLLIGARNVSAGNGVVASASNIPGERRYPIQTLWKKLKSQCLVVLCRFCNI